MQTEEHVINLIYRDFHRHRNDNEVLCAGITFINTEFYLLSVSHEDSPKFSIPPVSRLSYTGYSKNFEQSVWDLSALAYSVGEEIPELHNTIYMNDVYAQFSSRVNVNNIIPITVWGSALKRYNSQLLDVYNRHQYELESRAFKTTQTLVDVCGEIENSGIHVDRAKMIERFGDKVARAFPSDIIYSEYNPFTATGRPSNRFGGINFSALNKSDGTRDMITSRYENGVIVQIDFEAYHLRLVADYLGITLPKWESLHKELAKLYFKTDDITEELYSQSKQKTFEIMYGMSNESHGFELFEKIQNLRSIYKNQSDIELPSGVVAHVSDPSGSKLFNYYVQNLEVVLTIPILAGISKKLKNTSNHMILYTYDSMLFDMETFDEVLLADIIKFSEQDGKFPVRLYKGTTYGNIKEIKL